MTIRVLSFDFDGCLFNMQKYIIPKEKDVVKSNQPFLENLKQENPEFTKAYTFVGSNRQSYQVDMMNSIFGKGSCFPAVRTVSDYLGTQLDPFLLADVFGDLDSGTSYARAMDNEYQGTHIDWLFDETKVIILYAQMHKIALENPDEQILFDFFDDRGNKSDKKDILENLSDFYSKHLDLIPANVTLRLNHYEGDAVTRIKEIPGSGFIDMNYRQTVKDLIEQPLVRMRTGRNGEHYVADHAKPELLQNRKANLNNKDHEEERPVAEVAKINTSTSHSIADLELDSLENSAPTVTSAQINGAARDKFNAALRKIEEKANELNKEAMKLSDPAKGRQNALYFSYINAATAAHQLHNSLKTALVNYDQRKNKDAFQLATNEAIKTAMDSELKNHRGHLKQILGYAGIAVLAILTVATGGLAYAMAGVVNYAINRQFFFATTVNTDSINKVLDLKEATDKLAATLN